MQITPSRSPFIRSRFLILCFAILPMLAASASEKRLGKLPKDKVAKHIIHTLDGREFSLEGMRGNVVVLDFFAIWCGHSKHHIPSVTEFGEAEQKRGLQIIGLAVDDAESTPARVRKFIADMKIDYPVGMISDPDFARYVDSGNVSVPQTLVYARDGRLAAHINGHTRATEKELAEVINRELEKQ
jgi:thiol-disulfide isomerase/thioredoxin